jgi:putative transposase
VRRRNVFLDILEQVRSKYDFLVAGYVVMPEHFHLVIGDPRTQGKYIEMLRHIHRKPVKRGLVESPDLWRWSSYGDYDLGEKGKVKIGEKETA